jgi:PAS domain S-box-containing protein
MLRALYDSSSEALTLIDTNYKVLYKNKLAKQITKNIFGREAKIGDYSLDFYVPELREEFANYYQRVLQGETITVEKEYQGFWWRFNLYPVYDNENKIFGIATNLKDITRRKQQDLALYETQQRLNKIIEAVPHPLLIVDAETIQIIYVNAEFEKVFGYTEQEVIGKEVDFLLPERYRAKHRFLQEEYLKEGGLIKNMGRYLPALVKNGTEIYTDTSLNTFVADGKKYVIVILQDVTERKKQQDQILEQNKALQEIAWQQSHEVRRPVANILGLCNLLRDYKDEPEEIRDKYLEYMFKATQELDKIIHKIVEKVNEI